MSYQGHHPVESGLQNHSVGEGYPLLIVPVANSDQITYQLENLKTGKVLCGMSAWKKLTWDTYAAAARAFDYCHDKGFIDGVGLALYWASESREPVLTEGSVPVVGTRSDHAPDEGPATPAEERQATKTVAALLRKPVHGGFPGDTPASQRLSIVPKE